MKVQMFAGAGGTGKTTLVNLLEKRLSERYKVQKYFSTTRKTFERLGMSDEMVALLKHPNDQLVIQQEVFNDYTKSLAEATAKAISSGMDFLLCDRSPFDYNGYVCSAIQSIPLEQLEARNKQAQDTVGHLLEVSHVSIYLLPPLAPWKVEDDGYRYNPPAKNIAWNATISYLLEEARGALSIKDPLVSWEKLDVAIRNPALWSSLTSERRAEVMHTYMEVHTPSSKE